MEAFIVGAAMANLVAHGPHRRELRFPAPQKIARDAAHSLYCAIRMLMARQLREHAGCFVRSTAPALLLSSFRRRWLALFLSRRPERRSGGVR